MERDPRVILMGEDIAGGMGAPGEDDAWGGPLGVTKGLEPIFGPRSRARYADHRERLRRRRGGRGGDRPAAGRRADVRRLLRRLLRPDLQPGRQVPLHVRRQGDHAAGRAHHVRRRLSRRLAAQPVPVPDLHPHPRPQGGPAELAVRGQGPADPVDPRRRSGDLLRAQGDVRRGGGGAGRALHDPVRRGEPDPGGRRRDDRRVRPHGRLLQPGRRQAGEGRHQLHRGRSAHHLAARYRHHPRVHRGDRAARGGRRGPPALQHGERHRRLWRRRTCSRRSRRRSRW